MQIDLHTYLRVCGVLGVCAGCVCVRLGGRLCWAMKGTGPTLLPLTSWPLLLLLLRRCGPANGTTAPGSAAARRAWPTQVGAGPAGGACFVVGGQGEAGLHTVQAVVPACLLARLGSSPAALGPCNANGVVVHRRPHTRSSASCPPPAVPQTCTWRYCCSRWSPRSTHSCCTPPTRSQASTRAGWLEGGPAGAAAAPLHLAAPSPVLAAPAGRDTWPLHHTAPHHATPPPPPPPPPAPTHPPAGQRGELHGEMVVGMGEALVGNYPGRALSFAASAGAQPQLLSLPGKREGLFAGAGVPHLIARSDSNGAHPAWPPSPWPRRRRGTCLPSAVPAAPAAPAAAGLPAGRACLPLTCHAAAPAPAPAPGYCLLEVAGPPAPLSPVLAWAWMQARTWRRLRAQACTTACPSQVGCCCPWRAAWPCRGPAAARSRRPCRREELPGAACVPQPAAGAASATPGAVAFVPHLPRASRLPCLPAPRSAGAPGGGVRRRAAAVGWRPAAECAGRAGAAGGGGGGRVWRRAAGGTLRGLCCAALCPLPACCLRPPPRRAAHPVLGSARRSMCACCLADPCRRVSRLSRTGH